MLSLEVFPPIMLFSSHIFQFSKSRPKPNTSLYRLLTRESERERKPDQLFFFFYPPGCWYVTNRWRLLRDAEKVMWRGSGRSLWRLASHFFGGERSEMRTFFLNIPKIGFGYDPFSFRIESTRFFTRFSISSISHMNIDDILKLSRIFQHWLSYFDTYERGRIIGICLSERREGMWAGIESRSSQRENKRDENPCQKIVDLLLPIIPFLKLNCNCSMHHDEVKFPKKMNQIFE